MKKLLFLLGFLAGAAHAQDEYYTLSSTVTTTTPDVAVNGTALPLTVSGWIETDGFGKSGFATKNDPASYQPLILAYQVNITFNGITETMSGTSSLFTNWPSSDMGVVATSKGLFCNLCVLNNVGGYPFFGIFAGRGTTDGPIVADASYQFGQTNPLPGTAVFLDFFTPALKNNFRIGNAPTTTMPTTSAMAAPEMDPGQAGAALMLLVGTALVLKGRRRG